jgi:mevalonate pyrophosphate decarboxylase
MQHRRFVLVIAALFACGACSGSGDEEASTTASSTQTNASTSTTEQETTTAEAGPSPEVVTWAKTWRRKFDEPFREAAQTFVKKAPSAVMIGSAADFALHRQVNKLLNCQLPLETRLAQTPRELRPVRKASASACRSAYLGVQKFTDGQNKASFAGSVTAESQALVNEGISRVKKGLKLLKQAEKKVARIAS